jgi:hypothetical protein
LYSTPPSVHSHIELKPDTTHRLVGVDPLVRYDGPDTGPLEDHVATVSDKTFDKLETDNKITEKPCTAALQTFESRPHQGREQESLFLHLRTSPLPHDVSWPEHGLLIILLGAAVVVAIYWVVTRVIARVFGYRM